MVDDLHSNLAGLWPVKRAAFRRVQFRPSGFIDFRLERPLQFLIRLIAAGEIGMTDKKGLTVIVRVNEPADNISSGIAANLSGGRVVDVQPFDLDLNLAIRARFDLAGLRIDRMNVRLTERAWITKMQSWRCSHYSMRIE